MYSNDLTQISQGFDNYIGALISSLHSSPEASKQAIVDILCKKIWNIIIDKNEVDLYAARPYIKSIISFLSLREKSISELESKINTKNIDSVLEDYKQVIQFFNNILINNGGENNDSSRKA